MGVYVNENVSELNLEQVLEEISPARRAYALRYRNELDRKLSVAVYLLLKEGLRREYGVLENPVIAAGPNGKPYLVDHPEVHFSFSHCQKAAACALSSRPVGIDVEEVSLVDWAVAERVLSPDELNAVRASAHPDVAFARYWTMKEALVKLRGEPLDEGRLPTLLDDARHSTIETRETAKYVMSVATACHGAKVSALTAGYADA